MEPTRDDIEKLRNQHFNHAGVKYSVLLLVTIAEDHYPVVDVPISRLQHNLDPKHNGRLDEPDGSAQFEERARQARDFPIVIIDDGELWVADGRHRLWRAKQEGRTYIRGRIVPLSEIPEFVILEKP